MKSKLLPVLLLFAAEISAQPVLNTLNGFTVGVTVKIYADESPVLKEGSAGMNVVWNFSTLSSADEPMIFEAVAPSTTPYSDDFPDANVAVKSLNFSGDITYSFLKNDYAYYVNSGYESATVFTTYSNPIEILNYPFSYGDEATSNYSGMMNDGSVNYGLVEIIGDGYGTLLLPSTTFNNCLRIREVRHDTITGTSTTGFTNDTSFKFYVVNYPEPLCQVNHHHAIFNGQPFDFLEIYWQETNQTFIENVLDNILISIYPNPVADNLMICLTSSFIGKITIENLIGIKMNIAVDVSSNFVKINVADLEPGIYSIQIFDGERSIIRRFMKS